jgi:RNA 2',3'-cyclic 3'-phosphodiesterase
MEQIRSFIAVELPGEVKSALRSVQEQLISDNPHVAKWVDPGSIHLTLKFLGNMPAGKTEAIAQAIKKAAQGIKPFCLAVSGLGAFPTLKRPQVVWVGLEGDIEQVKQLQTNIETQVSPLGFPTENRPFTAHLTLARLRDTAAFNEKERLGEKLSGLEIPPGLTVNVNCVSLMRSQLTPSGAIYTRLTAINL